jgi:hypothetical protein
MAVDKWLSSPMFRSRELPNMIEIISLLRFMYESCELPIMIKIILL